LPLAARIDFANGFFVTFFTSKESKNHYMVLSNIFKESGVHKLFWAYYQCIFATKYYAHAGILMKRQFQIFISLTLEK